jgi:hypothetical protein
LYHKLSFSFRIAIYGQLSTPTNFVDNNPIRPQNAISRIDVDVKSLMETGPGRFAVGSQFELIQRFFDRSTIPPNPNSQGYTKEEIVDFVGGQSSFNNGFYGWDMQQYSYDDGVDDYIERAWIYNSM